MNHRISFSVILVLSCFNRLLYSSQNILSTLFVIVRYDDDSQSLKLEMLNVSFESSSLCIDVYFLYIALLLATPSYQLQSLWTVLYEGLT